MAVFLGFDPGGRGGFGWAVLKGNSLPLDFLGCGVADHARGAFSGAMEICPGRADAAGVDAPLFWRPSGDRNADQVVRRAIVDVGARSATVGAVNSLRGACLVQGMLVALMAQERGISVTESHPKALLWLLGKMARGAAAPELRNLGEFVVGEQMWGKCEHERDAVLGALTAFGMHSRTTGWIDLFPLEVDCVSPLSAPGYWMPLGTQSN